MRRNAPPPVSARAYIVENPATGEMLAQRGAWTRVPIASITKLMTVIVALEHANWNDVVRVRADAAAVGESTVHLRAGERLTVGDLVKAALIQSANDAAVALADYVGHGDLEAFVAMMNAKAARARARRDTHFVRPDGLDVARSLLDARATSRCSRELAMRDPRDPRDRATRNDAIPGGRHLHTWNDLLGVFKGLYRRQDRPHGRGRLVRGRGGPPQRGHALRDRARQPDALAAERRPGLAAALGHLALPRRVARAARARLSPRRASATGRARSRSSPHGGRARRARRQAARRAHRRPDGARAPGRARAARRRGPHLLGTAARRATAAVAARSVAKPGLRRTRSAATRAGRSLTSGLVLVIVTVTLNAAIDRTLTVPNFQLGHRHRASQGLTLAGGKGINVARALKRLDIPVVATGLAGGRTGTRIVEELTAEAILNDFVRIADESRTSTAVVDPTAGDVHGDQRVGAARRAGRARDAARQAQLPRARRRHGRLRRHAAARRRATLLRRGDPRAQPARRPSGARLRGRAAAPRRRGGAVPRRAEPARGRGRSSARSSATTRTYSMALDRIADLGARNVLITRRRGCFGLFREERKRALLPRGRAAGRAGFRRRLGRRAARRVPRRAARGAAARGLAQSAVAAGAASTLEVGAGRFEPREASRLQSSRRRAASSSRSAG